MKKLNPCRQVSCKENRQKKPLSLSQKKFNDEHEILIHEILSGEEDLNGDPWNNGRGMVAIQFRIPAFVPVFAANFRGHFLLEEVGVTQSNWRSLSFLLITRNVGACRPTRSERQGLGRLSRSMVLPLVSPLHSPPRFLLYSVSSSYD